MTWVLPKLVRVGILTSFLRCAGFPRMRLYLNYTGQLDRLGHNNKWAKINHVGSRPHSHPTYSTSSPYHAPTSPQTPASLDDAPLHSAHWNTSARTPSLNIDKPSFPQSPSTPPPQYSPPHSQPPVPQSPLAWYFSSTPSHDRHRATDKHHPWKITPSISWK